MYISNIKFCYVQLESLPLACYVRIHISCIYYLSFRSPDGHTLLISSTDGYCTFIRFGDDELGELYTDVKVQDSSEVKAEKSTSEKSSPTASSVSSKVKYILILALVLKKS